MIKNKLTEDNIPTGSIYYVYSKPGCSYCDKAKALLAAEGQAYAEYVLDVGQEKIVGTNYYTVEQLKKLVPNARTVPQIFENETLIGGFDALKLHLSKKG